MKWLKERKKTDDFARTSAFSQLIGPELFCELSMSAAKDHFQSIKKTEIMGLDDYMPEKLFVSFHKEKSKGL